MGIGWHLWFENIVGIVGRERERGSSNALITVLFREIGKGKGKRKRKRKKKKILNGLWKKEVMMVSQNLKRFCRDYCMQTSSNRFLCRRTQRELQFIQLNSKYNLNS